MKKITLLLTAILFTITGIFAQTPNQFKYQAILRDASGNILANEEADVDISILQGSATGTSVFDETHNVTTTAQGLINLNIGSVSDMSVIDWSADIYFVEITVNGTIMGTSQLLSVPYALYAKIAETADYNNLTNLPTLFDGNWNSLTGTAPNISIFNNDAAYLTSFTEIDPMFTAWNKDYNDLINTPNIVDTVSAVLDTAMQWKKTGNNIYYNTGLVGIGVSSPTASLDIYDNVGYPFLKFVSEDNIYTQWISDRANVDDYLIGIDGGNNRFLFANTTTGNYPLVLQNDNVGIGTLTPLRKLHIADNTSLVRFEDTDNNMIFDMGISSNGASWTIYDKTHEKVRFSINSSNGNVGIGTISPNAKLEVNADASNVGLIVKANISSPSNIQEWKNGSNTTLNYVPNDGGIVFENLNTPNKGIKFMADQTTGVSGAYGLYRPVANNTTSGLTVMPSGTGGSSMLSIFATDALADESNSRGMFIGANNTHFFIWPRNYGTETARPLDFYKPGNDFSDNGIGIRLATNGYVGISIANPEAPLHINDFMKLEPRSTAPVSPTKGMIYYDDNDDKIKVYTGSSWENLN